jgi:hypothetical protein
MARKERSVFDKARKAISTHRRGAGTVSALVVGGSICAVLAVILIIVGLVNSEPACLVTGCLALVAGGGVFAALGWYLHATPAEVRVYPFGVKWRARGREYV